MQKNTLKNRILLGLLSWLICTAALAAGPLWTMVPAPESNPTQTVSENSTATMQYVVQNQSAKPKNLVIQPIQGITQSGPCILAPRGQVGSSCTLTLIMTGSALPQGGVHGGPALCQANPDGSPNPNQCYQPSQAYSLNITRGTVAGATISVNPTTLLFTENSTGDVTVTNSASSPLAANNVTATIPGGSSISVQSTTCGVSLAIGASCTITFASGTQEGPTTIPIAGDNTNTVSVNVTVTSRPVISIFTPQQDRVVTVGGDGLGLQITNDEGSVVNAENITVSNQAACPGLVVNATGCTSVAPGATCSLLLTSPTPYAPCMITISGSNTANSPQTLIAFSYLEGLVFEAGGMGGKVVSDVEIPSGLWTAIDSVTGAISLTDGAANTDIIVADAACTGSPDSCAAQRCRNIGAVWYLPAGNELYAVYNALCSNAGTPCNFGGFVADNYWSSTENDLSNARVVEFPSGTQQQAAKFTSRSVRCTRAFP